MLHDPKWELKNNADQMSLASLIAWLETQPANKQYCYADHGKCLISQYLKHAGYRRVFVYSCGFFDHGRPRTAARYPERWDDIAISGHRTFGAALARARAFAGRE